MNYIDKSTCHEAPVKAYLNSDGVNGWECTKCRKPCELMAVGGSKEVTREGNELERIAMSIVHLVGRMQSENLPERVTSVDFVRIRQASNDEAIDAVIDLIEQYTDQKCKEARIDELNRVKKSDNYNNTLSIFGRVEVVDRLDQLKRELENYINHLLHQAELRGRIDELKQLWNATQPDIVPEGWKPDTDEARYAKDRIATLSKQLEEAYDNK